MGAHIADTARHTLRALAPQIQDIQIHLVWDPLWNPSMMSSEAKAQMGW